MALRRGWDLIRRLLAALLLVPVLAQADYTSVVSADSPTHWYHIATDGADSGTNTHVSAQLSASNSALNATGCIPGMGSNACASITGQTNNGYIFVDNSGNAADYVYSTTSSVGWSVEVWARPTAVNVTQVIGGKANGHTNATSGDFWDIVMVNATSRFLVYSNNGAPFTCGGGGYGDTGLSGSLSANTWHHFVGTTLGAGSSHLTNMKFYVDGAIQTTVTSFSASPNDTACVQSPSDYAGIIGLRGHTDISTNAISFGGKMDEWAYYATQLSATQVAAHYNAGIASFSPNMPYTVERDKVEPMLVALKQPQVILDEPSFVIDDLNRRAIRTKSQYVQ